MFSALGINEFESFLLVDQSANWFEKNLTGVTSLWNWWREISVTWPMDGPVLFFSPWIRDKIQLRLGSFVLPGLSCSLYTSLRLLYLGTQVEEKAWKFHRPPEWEWCHGNLIAAQKFNEEGQILRDNAKSRETSLLNPSPFACPFLLCISIINQDFI